MPQIKSKDGNPTVAMTRNELYERKWDNLRAMGITPPKDEKERQDRLRAAHNAE